MAHPPLESIGRFSCGFILPILPQALQQLPRPAMFGVELEGLLGGLAGCVVAAEGLEDLALAPPGADVAGAAAFQGFAEHLIEGGESFRQVLATAGGDLAQLEAEEAGGLDLDLGEI